MKTNTTTTTTTNNNNNKTKNKNSNTMKTLSFATMHIPPHDGSIHANTINTVESGALFRSVSMGVSSPPPLLHTNSIGTLLKSHSSPYPDGDEGSCPRSTIGGILKTTDEEWVWKLSKHQLSLLPAYHPVERTAIVISDIPIEHIARRISSFLKQHSIPAKYETSRVSCVTEDLLKFIIQLWQSPEGGVIVEVQRRQGCCIAMQAIRHRLLESILTGVGLAPPPVPSRMTCGVVQRLVERTQVVRVPPVDDDSTCCASAVELAKGLLQSDRVDAQRLGLESLCSLTNPNHVLLRDADEVSHTILMEPDWQKLLGRYFGLRGMDEMEDDLDDELHFLALKAVTQAIQAVAVSKASMDLSTPFWSRLMEDLFQNLTMASSRPLEASWSTRCFRYLQMLHPELLKWIPNRPSLYLHLVHAHDFGKQHHLSLEMETEQWMGRLGFAY